MTIASEPADGYAVRSRILNFLKYGANSNPADPRVPFYRHPIFVRVAHWTNVIVLTVMLMSGLQIFNAHSALYWGYQSDFNHPLLSMVAMQNDDGSLKGVTQIGPWQFDTTGWLGASQVNGQWAVRGFPAWATIPGPQWLALGRLWHFFFAWLFVANGAIFASLAVYRGHFRRDLKPKVSDITGLPAEIAHHAKLQFPKGEAAKTYNGIQRLTYFTVIFIIGPLIVLTGLTMSPTLDSAFPFLPWLFGGRQSARTIHFLCAFSFVLFFIVHIVMVVLSGTWNNVRAMITGTYEIEQAGGRHG
ncbi:MAG: cytochrome b/b6 domain-containing protein [Proteobacteria bacterium]|nr:cytochrome b/b6 domain-containing protein [Pseudomonadota bacterium]